MRCALASILLATLWCNVSALRLLDMEFYWRTPHFDFPSSSFRRAHIRSGRYIRGNSVPLDVDSTGDGRVWMTLPRLLPGVPATLVTVPRLPGIRSPLLRPYPSWEWHHEGDCNGITSVFRMQVDRCNRLWVLDTGTVDILNTTDRICPPQLLVFDTTLDRLLVRYRYPSTQLVQNSLLTTVAVDLPGNSTCGGAVAYAADVTGFGLIAFDLLKRHSWRINSNYFYPYPRWGTYRVAGDDFDLMDGVIGLALSPPIDKGGRILFFHSLASDSESWVPTSVLRDYRLFKENGDSVVPRAFHVFEGTRHDQSAAQAMDDDGILFFGLVNRNSLMCWNSMLNYNMNTIVEVEHDNKALQFASGVKVIRTETGIPEVWVITTRFQKVFTGTLDVKEVNFRILRAPVERLVKGTKCEVF